MDWITRAAGAALGLLAIVLSVPVANAAQATPPCLETPAAVVRLAGTPHLFVVDEQRVLHWAGDTRGLARRPVDWNTRCEVNLETLLRANRGDPWLSSGLPKLGDPIYLSKWEDTEPFPTLLHILSLADVELFGITATNYGRFVLDRITWQDHYGFDPGWLRIGPLASAASYAWPEADRAAYATLLGQMQQHLSAHMTRANERGIDAGLVLPGIVTCERLGLEAFDRDRDAETALAATRACLDVLAPAFGG